MIQDFQTNEDLSQFGIDQEAISNHDVAIEASEMPMIDLIPLLPRFDDDPFKDVPNAFSIGNIFQNLLPVVELPSFQTLEERKTSLDLLEVRFVFHFRQIKLLIQRTWPFLRQFLPSLASLLLRWMIHLLNWLTM